MKKRQTKTIARPMLKPRRRPRKFRLSLRRKPRALKKAKTHNGAEGAGVDAGAAGAAAATVMINPWESQLRMTTGKPVNGRGQTKGKIHGTKRPHLPRV
jgi:hypothetical protein